MSSADTCERTPWRPFAWTEAKEVGTTTPAVAWRRARDRAQRPAPLRYRPRRGRRGAPGAEAASQSRCPRAVAAVSIAVPSSLWPPSQARCPRACGRRLKHGALGPVAAVSSAVPSGLWPVCKGVGIPAVTTRVLSQYQRSTRTCSLPAHLVDRAKSMNLASSSLAAPCPAAASGLSR